MAFRSKQVPISSKNNRAARLAHARAKAEFKTYDTSAIQPKRSKAPMIVGIILCVIAVIAIVVALVMLTGCSSAPLLSEDEEAVVTVSNGEGARAIADSLVEEHLISRPDDFLSAVDAKKAASLLIPGTYVFSGGTSPEEILAALMEGPAATGFTLTVPEGFTRAAVADAVESATHGHVSADQFMDATSNASDYASDYDFLSEVGSNSLEGFLFPKTYSVTVADSAEAIAQMMLDQYEIETSGVDWAYPNACGLNQYDALKLASIVEKEANVETMTRVASVFYNRLASDRPYLESDATTAYEVGHDPSGEEVHANSEYSTYSNAGLPPTPICNPSLAAIQAVCDPAVTDYMYFFTHSDGSYSFSQTYEEHQQAIQRG